MPSKGKQNPLAAKLKSVMKALEITPSAAVEEAERQGSGDLVTKSWVNAAYYSGQGKMTEERAEAIARVVSKLGKVRIKKDEFLTPTPWTKDDDDPDLSPPNPGGGGESADVAFVNGLLKQKGWTVAHLVNHVLDGNDTVLTAKITDALAGDGEIPADFMEAVREKFETKKPPQEVPAGGLTVPAGLNLVGKPIEKLRGGRFAVFVDEDELAKIVFGAWKAGQIK